MSVRAAAEAPPCESAPNFRKYSAVYDLLYRDKDYAAESDYVGRKLRAAAPDARSILELGCGTGKHGRLLAEAGFDVHGIERSPDMVALAQSTRGQAGAAAGGFACEVGDVRSLTLDRSFDAVIALFHVVSYQANDDDLLATFRTAARHLRRGGLFLFDVWHGPAVLAQRPQPRVKEVSDADLEVVRTARPKLDTARRTVTVSYDIACRDRHSGEVVRFSEDHVMRYLFPDEIDGLAARCGLHVIASEEFMTGRVPSASSWGVIYALRKPAAVSDSPR